MTANRTVAERIVELLVRSGTDVAFGFPGETSLPYYVALQHHSGHLRHVLARCPRCAGYMADGYARIAGRVGVCDAPGGIGSPYLAPAMHEARNSSVPLLVIASGVARTKRGRWSTSECDQQALFRAIAKKALLVDEPSELDRQFGHAMATATTPRTGPVFLELPSDVLSGTLAEQDGRTEQPSCVFPSLRAFPDPRRVRECVEFLAAAKSPVVVAGGGVHLSGAAASLAAFVKATGLRVATTLNGKNSFPEADARSLGVTGAKGHVSTNELVQSADCILVLGSKLGDKSTNGYAWPRDGQIVLHVDADPLELACAGPRYVPVLADIGAFLDALAEVAAPSRARPNDYPAPFWPSGLTDHLCRRLSHLLPPNAILVADASVSSGWAGAAVRFTGPEQRLITPRGSGSLGYALPAAIGAQFARPGASVVAIGGDGGFAMAMHEMETARRYRLPITYFLLNNRRLGLIDKHVEHLLGGRPVSAEFGDLDWPQIARAFGWRAHTVTSTASLDAVLPSLLPANEPTLVEVRIPPEEDAPDFIITSQRSRS